MTTVAPGDPNSQPQPAGAAGQPPPYMVGAPAVMYNPAMNPGMNQPISVVQQVIQLQPEQFLTDYRIFVMVITIVFGLMGPVSLLTGIPAVLMAIKGYDLMKKGSYVESRTRSILSVYLSFGTMFISILTTSLLVCLLLGFRWRFV